jgi:hypothetical protein
MAPTIRYDPQDRTYTVRNHGLVVGVCDTWDAAHELKESIMEDDMDELQEQNRGRE